MPPPQKPFARARSWWKLSCFLACTRDLRILLTLHIAGLWAYLFTLILSRLMNAPPGSLIIDAVPNLTNLVQSTFRVQRLGIMEVKRFGTMSRKTDRQTLSRVSSSSSRILFLDVITEVGKCRGSGATNLPDVVTGRFIAVPILAPDSACSTDMPEPGNRVCESEFWPRG